MTDRDLLLAVLLERLGGRQVVTDEEQSEAVRWHLEAHRQSNSLILEVHPRRTAPTAPRQPVFHLEGEA